MTALDADDATYGNSAKVVYSILEGQPYFSVDPDTGQCRGSPPGDGSSPWSSLSYCLRFLVLFYFVFLYYLWNVDDATPGRPRSHRVSSVVAESQKRAGNK